MEMAKEAAEVAKARARRVRSLREALRYSRDKFCKKHAAKHGVTYAALQSWEAIRWNGLTEGGARKLAACFQDEGLTVTVEWLMFGIGSDPIEEAVKKGISKILPEKINDIKEKTLSPTASHQQKNLEPHNNTLEKENIVQELTLFHQLNPGSVDAVVIDDGLSPYLQIGDHVAGKRYFDNEMEKGIGRLCIVQTLSGNVLIRLLKPGSDVDRYTLLCTNPETTAKEHTIEDVKLFSTAPILWVRKPH